MDINAVSIENRKLKSYLTKAEWLIKNGGIPYSKDYCDRRDAFLAAIKKGDD